MAVAPLKGMTVLDMTNVLAGPFCCHQLAHMGADVIKVEVPGRGDLARELGPDTELNQALMGVSFLAQNAGKRSVTLNLKHEKGVALFKRMVAQADVVVENFRPGVMDRLGVGHDALKAVKPDLVYCAISGFGQDGPMRDMPAYDQIIQGISGVMSITGSEESAPLRVGYPLCDTIGGVTAAMAISAALAGRDRQGGSFIDVSMLEATLATMGWVVSNFLIAGIRAKPFGNENFTAAPSGTFQAADAPLNIAANKQEQFESLCRIIGREDLIAHPHFAKRDDRKANRYALRAEIETALTKRPAKEWSDAFNRAGIPAGPVLEVPEIIAHPQIADRGMLATFPDAPGVERDVTVVRMGVKFDREPPCVDSPPPRLGEHNAEVYGDLGLSVEEIESYAREGII